MVGFKHFQLDFNQIRTDNKAFIEGFRLNHQILSSLLKTPELIGMENFSIQHRVPTTEGPSTTKAPTIEVILYINSEHN